jgi:sialidase-1
MQDSPHLTLPNTATDTIAAEQRTSPTSVSINRRQMLAAGSAAAWTLLGTGRSVAAAAPTAKILETKVISQQPQYYHGWPTVARRKSGELLVVYSGGREDHICPFGRVEIIRSHDEGKTWGWPRVLLDTEIDDRDAGVLETAKGTLLVTTFTSLYYENTLTHGGLSGDRLRRWQAAHNRLDAKQRQSLLGLWMLRSPDGGLTWSIPYECLVSSPHGPIQLADGRLLHAGKDDDRSNRVGVCESTDDGRSWRWLAEIPARPGDGINTPNGYHELHAVEAGDGRIVVQIRNHNKQGAGETLQTDSSDGGKTWSVPHSIGVWGTPSHLLRLKDGRLLMTYGYRRPPFGNQARVSEDHGRTWSQPMTISADGAGGDLGYPSTAQLADGTLLSVWYESGVKNCPLAVLRQAHWTLNDK